MSDRQESKYYLVEANALPEIFLKVMEAKQLLQTGTVKTVGEAVDKVGISRSAFYRYKDSIRTFQDMGRSPILSLSALLYDRPGVLGSMIAICTDSGANILTINQSLPTDGAAIVTISLSTSEMKADLNDLVNRIKHADGVISVEIVAG